MPEEIDVDCIDAIYETAAIPELWPVTLERIARLSGASDASLMTFDEKGLARFVTSPNYFEAVSDCFENGGNLENVRPKRAFDRFPAGFVSDLDVCSVEELRRDPIYTEYLNRYGYEWTAGTAIPTPGRDILVFDLARKFGTGPFERSTMERMDLYRPHLARAALLAHRLGLRAAQAATQALQHVGLPAATLTRRGRVLAANPLFEGLAPRVHFGAFDQVAFTDRPVEQLFKSGLLQLSKDEEPSVRSIPVPATDNGPALVLHLTPVRRSARDIFGQAAVIVIVSIVASPTAPLASLLNGLFDLTPAEARVARALADGASVVKVASDAGVSQGTIRKQLQSILAKTGTHRQSDLLLLLAAVAPRSPR